MLKNLLFIGITIIALVGCEEHSGLKFEINTNIFRYLKTANLNKIAQNRSLIPAEGIQYERTSFPSYKLNVTDLKITNLKNPESVDIFTRILGDNKYLNINLGKFEVHLLTTFDIAIVSVLSDHLENSPINITIDKIESEFFFHQGQIHFNKLDVTIGKIDMQFNSIFFKTIYALADKLVVKAINFFVSMVYTEVEAGLNKFISQQLLIDVGMGIGINATNVDRPELEVFNQTNMRSQAEFENFETILSTLMVFSEPLETSTFLAPQKAFSEPVETTTFNAPLLAFSEPLETTTFNAPLYAFSEPLETTTFNAPLYAFSEPLENTKLSPPSQATILKFGIHGSIYPNAAPDVHPDIAPVGNMSHFNQTLNSEFSILISDYSINTLLFMGQQTGALKYVFNNETNKILNFTVDTEGLSKLIPEFKAKYPDNKPVEIKLYVSPVKNKQPSIYTQDDGVQLFFNYGLDFNVYNSSDPWDDPNKELQLNVTLYSKLQFLISENKLNIILSKAITVDYDKLIDNLGINEKTFRPVLESIADNIFKSFEPYLTNIDPSSLAKNFFGIELNNLQLLTVDQFLVLSVDLVDV